jgi:hypothetical protein
MSILKGCSSAAFQNFKRNHNLHLAHTKIRYNGLDEFLGFSAVIFQLERCDNMK